MDKNAIKTYAIWARNELRDRVSKKMDQYEITAEANPNADSVRGKLLSNDEKAQRAKAIMKVNEKGFDQVVEEVAYTWFNRFSALRFMEVNNYLPTRIRVFTDENNEFRPQILSEAIHMELDGLDMEKVYELKEKNNDDELFKYLIITQCNALSKILPGMFQKIADYTELLFPDNLLRKESIIDQMISTIPEDNWTDQVQIIGWLYQYYNTEQNEVVYDGSFSKDRIPKELLPAATTIYTPNWPVEYMVQNSLGRLWLEGHPDEGLKSEWRYYLDEVEQESAVQTKLVEIRKDYEGLKPDDILVIDPCQGSGHILCVLFDTLMSIYGAFGYSARDSVRNIVEKNIWGLDIDERAAQLAYFSVMMKARQYDSRFLVRRDEEGEPDIPQPHVYSIVESNGLEYDGDYCELLLGDEHLDTLKYLLNTFKDAKEYGSILDVKNRDYKGFLQAWDLAAEQALKDVSMLGWYMRVKDDIISLAKQAMALSQAYHTIVTNPPYLGMARYSPKLDSYVKNHFADVKSDLSMIMYNHAITHMAKKNGFVAFITTSSWMFLSSFEKLRASIFSNGTIDSLVDCGTELFEGKVGHNPIVTWVTRISDINRNYIGVRLVDYCYSRRDEKETEFFNKKNYHITNQAEYLRIPSSPIAYWVSKAFVANFDESRIGDTYFSGGRNKTHNNEKYLRFWWEISDRTRWQIYDKGGDFRRWYGNHDYVVDWSDDAKKEYESHGGLYNQEFSGKDGICWTLITSAKTGFRIKVAKNHYDSGSPVIFNDDFTVDEYVLGFLNSCVAYAYLSLLNPTINMGNTYVLSLPLIIDDSKRDRVIQLVKQNLSISRIDWDSFETSEDFSCNPIVGKALCQINRNEEGPITIENVYKFVTRDFEENFQTLKENEEELNRIFIDIYGLQDELSPEVEDKEVTVRCPDRERDIKNFISYAVGCMMGRYSYGASGLEYAGGIWDASKYKCYPADEDGILPICDDEYFEDDIVGRFVDFVKEVFGAETLEENLRFIADSLSGSGAPREIIRNYFLNGFYADHLKMYQKRPIYWLFDSGKKNGFKCLVYMHRYKPDTIARIRTDYVHEQQSRYRTAIAGLERQIADASTSERVRLNKRLSTLKDQAEETRKYEEKIHHLADQMISIDLDDGVKHNYEIFKDVLAKIK